MLRWLVVGGDSNGDITSNGTMTTGGSLTITDVDTSDQAVTFEDEAEQQAISLMRQLRADGLSLRRIAERLQTQGFTNRIDKRLSPQLIANVLGRS